MEANGLLYVQDFYTALPNPSRFPSDRNSTHSRTYGCMCLTVFHCCRLSKCLLWSFFCDGSKNIKVLCIVKRKNYPFPAPVSSIGAELLLLLSALLQCQTKQGKYERSWVLFEVLHKAHMALLGFSLLLVLRWKISSQPPLQISLCS